MSTTSATVDGFAAQIRAASTAAHEGAEHSAFLDALASGRLDPSGAAAYTAQLFFVYQALEGAAGTAADDPVARRFVFPELARRASLECDLEVMLGSAWRGAISPSGATSAYVARIEEVGHTWPGGYVAHAYTRYLGDLSGGRAIRRWVQQSLGTDGDEGTSFYDFPGIASPAQFKDEFRARLDAVTWSPLERSRVIDEVLLAYRHNTALLLELGARVHEWARPASSTAASA